MIATGKELFASETGDLVIASPDERLLAVTESPSGDKMKRVSPVGNHAPQLVGEFISDSGVIKLVDAATGKETARILVEGSQVWALAFAPDGKTLAATTGWETGRIHLFDVASGKEVRTIESPPLRSPALAFTPDGSHLVSATADGSVLVWDVRGGSGERRPLVPLLQVRLVAPLEYDPVRSARPVEQRHRGSRPSRISRVAGERNRWRRSPNGRAGSWRPSRPW